MSDKNVEIQDIKENTIAKDDSNESIHAIAEIAKAAKRTQHREDSSRIGFIENVTFGLPESITDKKKSITELLDEEDNDDDVDVDVDEQDSIEELEPNQESIEYSMRPDFFNEMASIANLSDISEPVSEDVDIEGKETVTIERDVNTNVGAFVDPLTGVIEQEEMPITVVTDLKTSQQSIVKEVTETEEEVDVKRLTIEFEEDAELLLLLLEDKRERDTQIAAQAEQISPVSDFMATDKPIVVDFDDEDIDAEALFREELARCINEETNRFLDDLIAAAVQKCEFLDRNLVLREYLDKGKLMSELTTIVIDLHAEQFNHSFLNKRVADFFRRKRQLKVITEEPIEQLKDNIEKYEVALKNLNILMEKEIEVQEHSSANIKSLHAELLQKQIEVDENIDKLENQMRDAFKRDNAQTINLTVDAGLSKLEAVRNDISEMRIELVFKQHALATLKMRLAELERVGNNLSIREFDHLQTETQTLSRKIEERNVELMKSRIRFHSSLHKLAHIKGNTTMLQNAITQQKQNLTDLNTRKQMCRSHLYYLKLTSVKFRSEINAINLQSGLIDKPALMRDFDDTISKLNDKRTAVNQTKRRIQIIQQKITNLEEKYNKINM